ncbi:MAG: hypothetical protein H7839_06845 [Magnetococcus sp. YQC-5]
MFVNSDQGVKIKQTSKYNHPPFNSQEKSACMHQDVMRVDISMDWNEQEWRLGGV